jgi:hypothetical protein
MANIERLRKLADHLMHGKLGHQAFDFKTYNSRDSVGEYNYNLRLRNCGTAGCALGECPFVFKEWYFDVAYNPVFGSHFSPKMSAIDFFDISWEEVDHLFMPRMQLEHPILEEHSSRQEVAENIYRFIDKVTSNPDYFKQLTVVF